MGEALQVVQNEASDLILDAAERIFADCGFEGATTRAIAEAAGVTLALIHYHHRSKEALFVACFNRRAEQINARRHSLLDELPIPGASPAEIVEAFIRPSVELGRGRGGAVHYGRLLAVVASGTDQRSRALTSAAFDDIARRFIATFRAAEPTLDPSRAVQAYLFAASISVSLMAATGRATDLGGNDWLKGDTETLIREAVTFIAGGIKALTAEGPKTSKGGTKT